MAAHDQGVPPSAVRNARHMRKFAGFYPTDKDQENATWFVSLNERCIAWLKENKISGKNAREHFGEMSKFASDEAQALYEQTKLFPTVDEFYTLTYATLLSAMGSFENFLSLKRKRESEYSGGGGGGRDERRPRQAYVPRGGGEYDGSGREQQQRAGGWQQHRR